jgi:molybdopterin/thiamine biosynthesis adenylyltransferase
MSDDIRFTDALLDAVNTQLASFDPERGGALLAAGGLVHHLVEDVDGAYTGVSWDISAQLTRRVRDAESSGRGTLAGTVHTHPRGSPDPSSQDLRATARQLDANPHLDSLALCVVTEGTPRPGDLPVGRRHRMSVHRARRTPTGCEITRAHASVAPLAAAVTTAGIDPSTGFVLTHAGAGYLALPVDAQPPRLLAVGRTFPLSAPLMLAVGSPGGAAAGPATAQLEVLAVGGWDPTISPTVQVRAMLDTARNWQPEGIGARTVGLTGRLADQRVLVAGVGSVGSWIAEELARAGVEHFVLLDPDIVEEPNLSRTIYEAGHRGLPKPEAARDVLRRINPAIEVEVDYRTIAAAGRDFEAMCQEADLVIAATDDPLGQAQLCHYAYLTATPFISCALYRQAAAGEVLVVIPEAGTPCWSCATGQGGVGRTAPKDYGTGRLAAEVALGPAIHLVAEVAAGVAVSVLAGPTSIAGQALADLLGSGRTMGIIATSPNWDFFPKVFDGMGGHQWAPQSVWATVRRDDPDCPVCGTNTVPPVVDFGAAVERVRSRLRRGARGRMPQRIEPF